MPTRILRTIIVLVALGTGSYSSDSAAEEFCNFDGCAEFPAGAISFADEVPSYMPVGSLDALVMETDEAIGIPDTDLNNLLACQAFVDCNFLTLGTGGSAVFKFTDNVLTGSGDSADDLFIFETGPFTQGMNVDISQDGVTWYSVGSVIGDVDGVDIDAFLAGHGLTVRDAFRYVRLTDDGIISAEEQDESSIVAGADIDAVGALSAASRAQQWQQRHLGWVDVVDGLGYLARGRIVANPQVWVDYHDVSDDVGGKTPGASQRHFPSDTSIVDIASLPLGVAEPVSHVAVLGLNDVDGSVAVKIKHLMTGALINQVPFETAFAPRWLRVVPDTGMDGSVDLAVLGINLAGRIRVQIKDALTGTLVNKVFFDPDFQPFGFTVIGDLNMNGADELVVFGINSVSGEVRAEIRDSVTGARVGGAGGTGLVNFDKSYGGLIAIGVDTDGVDGNDALAVLGSNDEGYLRSQVKVAADATLFGLVGFDQTRGPQRMVAFSPNDGLGAPALGLLHVDSAGDEVNVQVKNLSGVLLQRIRLHPGSTPIDLLVIPDVDFSGSAEVAYLGTNDLEGEFIQVKDALLGTRVFRANVTDSE